MTQARARAARDVMDTLVAAEPPVHSVHARTIATGFTANLDLLLVGGPALTAQMRQWRAAGTAAEARVWQAILDEQERCVASGRGSELTLEPAAVLQRLDAYVHATTIGGTGVRAAAQAARLGQRTIASIPAADPRLVSLLARPLLSLIPTVPPPSRAPGSGLPLHYIIEMPAAVLALPSDGEEREQQPANRLILHGDEAQLPLCPEAFVEHLATVAPPVCLLLLSGFNIYTRLPDLDEALDQAARWLQTVRRCVPWLWVYLELAGYSTPLALQRVLGALGPLVEAVGMNEDEGALAADLDSTQPLRDLPPRAQLALLREAMTRYGLRRLVVHTAWASSYLGRGPLAPGERLAVARALALGNTAAGFRYAHGYDGTMSEMRRAAQLWTLAPEGLACAAVADHRCDAVVVPAWHIRRGAGHVGLGDAFTGAFLTGLDPPAPSELPELPEPPVPRAGGGPNDASPDHQTTRDETT